VCLLPSPLPPSPLLGWQWANPQYWREPTYNPSGPRLEYEARNQKKEAKELAFLEATKQQEAPPGGEID
jgi:hypothetical protein